MWPGNNVHKLHNREKQGVFLFQLCFWAAMLFLSLVLTRDSVLIRTCWSLSGIWTHQTWRRPVRSAASTLSSGWTLSLQTGGRRSDGGLALTEEPSAVHPSAAQLEREPAAWWHFLQLGNTFIWSEQKSAAGAKPHFIPSREAHFVNVTELKSHPAQAQLQSAFPTKRRWAGDKSCQAELTPATGHRSAYFLTFFLFLAAVGLSRMAGGSWTPAEFVGSL